MMYTINRTVALCFMMGALAVSPDLLSAQSRPSNKNSRERPQVTAQPQGKSEQSTTARAWKKRYKKLRRACLHLKPGQSSPSESCDGDINADGVVDPLDMGILNRNIGCDVSSGSDDCANADVNGDGTVDPLDNGYLLSRLGRCNETTSTPDTPTASCDGDPNGDGIIDPLDFGFITLRYGCTQISPEVPGCGDADLNNDGLVDPLDLGYSTARMGTCG